jgi:hypothetical protein
MTKENFTSINVIIDQSGSMLGLSKDTIGGFNTFLAEQKLVPGDAHFTLCVFNHDYRLVHDCAPLGGIPDLDSKTYRPSGNTALLDAMGATIDEVGRKLAALPEEERPSKVIFLIMTDGEENSSRRYNAAQVREMVTHQREKYQWEFVFMGANIDAISAGTSLGVTATNSVNYVASAAGTHELYGSVSRSLGSYRSRKSAGPVDFFNQPGSLFPSSPVLDANGNPIAATPDNTGKGGTNGNGTT